MEKTLKFNSQVATNRSQSERLLALGLKSETADMTIHIKKDGHWYVTADPFYEWEDDMNTLPCLEEPDGILPAWSLHRLILLLDTIACDWIFRNGDCYTNAINGIEWLIKKGYFNKEYLNGND